MIYNKPITNLTIVENKQLELAKSMIVNKPKLARIVDSVKIRDYPKSEIKEAQDNIINYLIALLGIPLKDDNKEKIKHYGMVSVLILEDYNHYAYEEIKEAFKMAIKGEFENYKLIYKLDCKMFGEIMSLYDAKMKEKLKIYKAQVKQNLIKIQEENNKPTREENYKASINGIRYCYNEYNKLKRIPIANTYLYEWLFKLDIMPKDKPTINAIKNEAKKRFASKRKLALSKKEAMMYDVLGRNGKVTNSFRTLCQEISLEQLFDKFKTEDQLINFIQKNGKSI